MVIQGRISKVTGQDCGLIIWESKQTKAWSDKWIDKLKDDLLSAQGEVGVIVSAVLPDNMVNFGLVD